MKLGARWTKAAVGQSIEPGIRKTVSGWQVYLRRDREFLSTHFQKDADLTELRRWRDQQIGRRMADVPKLTVGGSSFADEAKAYLQLVSGLTSISTRRAAINAWVQAFGAKATRADLTHRDIRRILDQWKRHGYKPATLNMRRMALKHLWKTLDPAAPNPVAHVPSYPDPFTGWQLPTWDEALKAVQAIDREDCRIKLTLMLWTGWPPSDMQRIRPERVNLPQLEVTLLGRRKGRGTDLEILPMLPQAADALNAFLNAQAWGGYWHTATLGRALKRGCKAANVTPFRVYDLRHVFGTKLATITKDDRVVAALMRHKKLAMTWRYTINSVAPRLKEALAEAAKHFD